MNEWIPDGWECRKQGLRQLVITHILSVETALDLAVDDLLASLKKDGQYVNNNPPHPDAMALVRKLKRGERGWMVFIHDDTEDEKKAIFDKGTDGDIAFYKPLPLDSKVIEMWYPDGEYFYNTEICTHPATQVIETGFFCPKCGRRITQNTFNPCTVDCIWDYDTTKWTGAVKTRGISY
jgi:hypothetical protein